MAKLKQKPHNFAQNFAILTQKRQINYLDSDDGKTTDDDDDDTEPSPVQNPPKKHKVDSHASPDKDRLPDQVTSQAFVQISQVDSSGNLAEETTDESEVEPEPPVRPRHTSAPPALGFPMRSRRVKKHQAKEQQPGKNASLHTIREPPIVEPAADRGTIDWSAPLYDITTAAPFCEVTAATENEVDNSDIAAPTKYLSPLPVEPFKTQSQPSSAIDDVPHDPILDDPPSHDLPFQVHCLTRSSQKAYKVTYQDEKPAEGGETWQSVKSLQSITKVDDKKFTLDDIVQVAFDSGPVGPARILEIREEPSAPAFLVIQWLYTRVDAMDAGATKKNVLKWPAKSYCLSNHFQVVTSGNLDSLSDVKIEESLYWDASGSKGLRPMKEMARKLVKQNTKVNDSDLTFDA